MHQKSFGKVDISVKINEYFGNYDDGRGGYIYRYYVYYNFEQALHKSALWSYCRYFVWRIIFLKTILPFFS